MVKYNNTIFFVYIFRLPSKVKFNLTSNFIA